jgi:hypothetical protein
MISVFAIGRWFVSLGVKFYRVVPVLTSAIVILTLVAQVAFLLSSLLPLKIIILLGSEGMPQYFPSLFLNFDRDLLIGFLSGSTLVFFLLSLLTEKVIKGVTELGTEKLLAKSQKMVLFENQNDIAARGYQRFSSAVASGVFIVLALSGLGWFYQSMALLIAGYLILVSVVLLMFYQRIADFRVYVDKNLGALLSLIANLGFLLVFGFLVLEFIFLSPPGFMISIVSLIAGRQVFARATVVANSISGLIQQRPRLDALFFHGKVLLDHNEKSSRTSLWGLLQPAERERWLSAVLKESGINTWNPDELSVSWLPSSQPNIPQLYLSHPRYPGKKYLIKIFDVSRRSRSQHEASLATVKPVGLPMPELLLVTEVDHFPCHLYKIPSGRVLKPKEVKFRLLDLYARLFGLSLPAELVGRYCRSRPLLGDRVTSVLLERLYIACSSRKKSLWVAEVVGRLPEIKNRINNLPVVLVNPKIRTSVWMSNADETLTIVNWENWSLEPLGAGWPVLGKSLDSLNAHLDTAKKANKTLEKVQPQAAQLAALMFELESLLSKQNFLSGIQLLPEVLKRLDSLQEEHI